MGVELDVTFPAGYPDDDSDDSLPQITIRKLKGLGPTQLQLLDALKATLVFLFFSFFSFFHPS